MWFIGYALALEVVKTTLFHVKAAVFVGANPLLTAYYPNKKKQPSIDKKLRVSQRWFGLVLLDFSRGFKA